MIDPVMVAKGGCSLMQQQSLQTLIQEILPLAEVLTPNLPEAEAIAGMEIHTIEDMKKAARQIYSMGPRCVLLKGGHLSEDLDAKDILFDGTDFYSYTTKRIATKNTHGTGCTFLPPLPPTWRWENLSRKRCPMPNIISPWPFPTLWNWARATVPPTIFMNFTNKENEA